jgi:four helix bundle protein
MGRQQNEVAQSPSTHFAKLESWQRALDLVEECYRLSEHLPKTERFALSDQLRRAAASVPANIAEGRGRGSQREFARFLMIARGSLMEVESHLLLARRLNFLTADQIVGAIRLRNEVGQLLNGLLRRMRTDSR